jgi:YVTN family beta-propeller protein
MALGLPVVLAGLLLGPAGPAHAAGALLYVPNLGGSTVSAVDTSSNTITASIPVGQEPKYTAVTPGGSQVFVTNLFSDIVSVIAASSDTVTATIPVIGDAENVVVDPSGAFAYVITSNGYLVKIATATDTVTGSVYVGDSPSALAIAPDGATVYVSGYSSAVSVVDTATLTVRAVVYTGAEVSNAIVVSPDGSQVYVAYDLSFASASSPSSDVTVISTETDQVTANVTIAPFPQASLLSGLAITPDGASVYVSDEEQDKVSVISTASDTVNATISGLSAPAGIAVNPAGTTAWVGTGSTVSVIDTASDTVTGTISGFRDAFGISESSSYYDFVGFFPPVADEPAVNQANAGQAIPMQFTLNGNQGLDIFSTGSPTVQQVDCATGVPVNTGTLTDTDTSGNTGLQYNAASDTYTYVWKTSKSWAGTCQKFSLGLNDGSTHTATFQFK